MTSAPHFFAPFTSIFFYCILLRDFCLSLHIPNQTRSKGYHWMWETRKEGKRVEEMVIRQFAPQEGVEEKEERQEKARDPQEHESLSEHEL